MLFRIAAICLLLPATACVNTPDGPRSALVFNNTSLLEAEPAELRAAYQTNLPVEAIPGDPGLTLKFMGPDEDVLMERRIAMTRLAQGKDVGFDLPPARESQRWTVWKPDADGVAAFREIQARVAEAPDGERALDIEWQIGKSGKAHAMDVVLVTFALRLTPDDPWFTLVDNLPVYRENEDQTGNRQAK